MSNANRALLILGAIGGVLYGIMRWLGPGGVIVLSGRDWLAISFIAYVLMILGVVVFYRKSGNPLHILTCLVILVHTVTFHFLHMLWVIDSSAFPWVGTDSIFRNELWGPILALTWLLMAVSVWMMREEYGNFVYFGVVVFVSWVVIILIDKVLGFVWPVFLTDINMYYRILVGAAAFLTFLYAAMKED